MLGLFFKKYSYFNILLNHQMNDDCTLLSEISIIAENITQAEDIANLQINKINKQLNSNFIIEKLWLKKGLVPLKFLNKKNEEITISKLNKQSFYLLNYNNHLNYLKQEHYSTFPKLIKPTVDRNNFIK
jgi:hypothetical protein